MPLIIPKIFLDNKVASWLMQTKKHKRRDVGEFLRLKVMVQEDEKIRSLQATQNYDFQAISKSEQSLIVDKILGSVGPSSLHLSFAVLKEGSATKRSSLVLYHRGSENFEYFRMDSHVGGLSAFVGEEDADDDKDPNASVQIKLLGVPLKPVTLFTSLSELMEIYWSGVAEKMTSYLSGTVQLISERDDTVLGNGLRLQVQLLGTLSLDLGAKAAISLWTQSGEVECENRGAVSLMARVIVGDSLLVSERMVTVEAALMSNIQISMSGGEPLVCVLLNQNPVRVRTLHKYGKGEDLPGNISNKMIDGLTWNLGHKNNMICNKLR